MLENVTEITYSVRLPVDLRDQLKRVARAQDRKPSDLVRLLIRREVEQANQMKAAGEAQPCIG